MDKVPSCVRHPLTGSGSLWYLVQETVEKEKSGEIYTLACLFIGWAIEKLPKIRYNEELKGIVQSNVNIILSNWNN